MGPTLNTAVALNAYTLSDRGTWLSFKNRGDLAILVEGDRRLFNQYGVMLVNPDKHPNVKVAEGRAFVDWLISPEGQAAIASHRRLYDQRRAALFSERPSGGSVNPLIITDHSGGLLRGQRQRRLRSRRC
jgi:ABC-type tungstate transport system permease subunit